jgi:hypothetical protein
MIALSIYFANWFRMPNLDKNDSASPKDVRYTLDACRLGNKQIEKVVHSHTTSHGIINAGSIDAFAVKISQIDDTDFVPKKDHPNEHWYRGDQLPRVLDAAVRLVDQWHDQIPWLPSGTELRSSDVHVYPVGINCCCGSIEPTAATLVFIRKTDRMMFYFDFEP